MSKKLSSLLIVAVCSFILGITGYMGCQSFDVCPSMAPDPTATAQTATPTPQTATATTTVATQAGTTSTQEAIATAQAGTATGQASTATAQADTASAQEATASAQEATATVLYATETAIAATQTAIAEGGSSPPTVMSPTINGIFERGYLIAGVKCDFFPMGYIQDPRQKRVDCEFREYENDERAGFEIEIVKEFAKRWLGNESAVEFQTVKNPEENIDKLTGGEVDLVAAVMTHTKDRDERISFSQTYFYDGQGLLVTDPNIKSVEDLDGKSVAVLPGTTSSANIEAEEKRLGITIKMVSVTIDDDGVRLLLNNKVDAYTTDSVRLIQLSQQDARLRFVEDESSTGPYRFSEEPYGIGVSKGDAEFRDLVNFTLQEMKLDGTYDRIYGKWFGPEFIYPIETWPGKSYLGVNLISMQRIEAGEFTLGIQGSATERLVSLEAFSIDQYEVTNRLYKQCVDDGKCPVPQNTPQYANPDKTNHPVTWITFEQAKEYCAYVGKQLPTEDQWEAAARGSDQRIYPWDNEPPTRNQANFNEFYTGTLEVIWSIPPHEEHVSPYGLHHMAGNVREWVLSESDQDVTRGGGWKDAAEDIRTTKRFVNDVAGEDVGFRCAVKADEFPSPSPSP
ncbi:MAG: SUMF1/EgtB/PvdO family nonheme iron enzyme [Ardenticatenaceae bacterium]